MRSPVKLEELAYHLSSTRPTPNRVMRERIMPFLREHGVRTVLDFGCGKYLRDARFLTQHGFLVDAVDLEAQIERIEPGLATLVRSLSTAPARNHYDAALLNFVLQVLPTKNQRDAVLTTVGLRVRDNGYLVLSLRNQRDMNDGPELRGIRFRDGFLMRRGSYYTFVRGYSKDEVEAFFSRSHFSVLRVTTTCYSHIAVGQKQ